MGINFTSVFSRIKDVVIKALISVEPSVVNAMSRSTKHRNVCFELYGFDVMLDSKLKPWLIEVNTNPCLELNSPLLSRIIPHMLENALR